MTDHSSATAKISNTSTRPGVRSTTNAGQKRDGTPPGNTQQHDTGPLSSEGMVIAAGRMQYVMQFAVFLLTLLHSYLLDNL